MVDLSKIAKKLKATLADDIEDSPDMTSTGNLAFDLIIDGGMPFGYVVELLGLSQSGKCLSANSNIFVEGLGLISIGDFATYVNNDKKMQKDEVKHHSYDVLSNHCLEQSSIVYYGGYVDTLQIKTRKGHKIEADPTHKVKVLRNSKILFIEIQELVVGDYVVLSKNYNEEIFKSRVIPDLATDKVLFGYNSPKYTMPTTLSKELAELMGYIVANGYTCSKNAISISSISDEVKNRIVVLGKILFNKEFLIQETCVSIFSKAIKEFFIYLDSAGVLSDKKRVPPILWKGDKKYFYAFLSAYFKCDGYVDKKGRVELCSASKKLMDDISFFLLGEDIIHKRAEKNSFASNSKNPHTKTYYHIYIESTQEANKLLFNLVLKDKHLSRISHKGVDSYIIPNIKEIILDIFAEIKILEGSVFKYKFAKGRGFSNYLGEDLHMLFNNGRFNKDRQNVKYSTLNKLYNKLIEKNFPNKVLLNKLLSLVDKYILFDEIVSITDSKADVYDVSIPESKQYIANNFIVHNSNFIQKIIATAQKKYGAVGVLVDRENAFFKPRAKELGIDTKNLFLAKPKDTPGVSSGYAFIIDAVTAIRAQDEEIAIAAAKNKKAQESIKKTGKYKKTHIVIAIDSVAAFESDVDLGKSDSGRKAQQHHAGLRKILPIIDEQMMFIVANQVTHKIGVLFGDNKTTTAGESYKYYGTVRCSLQEKNRIVAPEMNNEVIGTWIEAEVIKTRLGPCYRSCMLPFLYKDPIPYYGGIARLLVNRNIMKPTNADDFKKFKSHTVTYKGEKVNEFEMEAFLAKHPEIDLSKYPEYNIEKSNKKELTSKEE